MKNDFPDTSHLAVISDVWTTWEDVVCASFETGSNKRPWKVSLLLFLALLFSLDGETEQQSMSEGEILLLISGWRLKVR